MALWTLFLSIFLYGINIPYLIATPSESISAGTVFFHLTAASENMDALYNEVPESFFVHKVTYESDVFVQQSEFDYLVSIPEQSFCSRRAVQKACEHLKKKHKFETIHCTLQPEHEGYSLHFYLQGFWTISHIRFKGLWHGSDRYKKFYTMAVGDRFDMKRHTHALEKIKNVCYAEGYFNADIIDHLTYDPSLKGVDVTVVVHCKKKFRIKQVVCSSHISQSSIVDKFEHKLNFRLKNKYYSSEVLNKEATYLKKKLLKHGFFNSRVALQEHIDRENSTVSILFLLDLPVQHRVIFSGNYFFNKRQLLDHLFVGGKAAIILPERLLLEELQEAYTLKGFWNSSIEIAREESDYFFSISEGNRAVIQQVRCTDVDGNELPDAYAIAQEIAHHGYFEEEFFKRVYTNLVEFYRERGFWDISIHYTHVFLGGSFYRLEMTIDKGNQRHWESVAIKNHPELLGEGPFTTVQQGSCVDFNQIHVQRQWLMRYFQQKGYLNVKVNYDMHVNDYAVSLIWNISEIENPVTFGKTIVIGSSTFPFEYIMRELTYHEHEIWSREKLEDSLSRLRNLGIFEHVYLAHTVGGLEKNNERMVVLKIQEDDSFEVRIRGGAQQVSKNLAFRSGTTYKVGASFLYKNPFNKADLITVEGDFTLFTRLATFEYQVPWIGPFPVHTRIKGYSNKFIQPVYIGSRKPLYQAIQQGVLCGLDRQWRNAGIGVNIGCELMETNHLSHEIAHAINFEIQLIDQKVPYFYIEPSLLYDTLDNQLDPRRGSLTVISSKTMIPCNTIRTSFIKILAEHSRFLCLYKNTLVLALRIRFGHIFNTQFNKIMPPERFYLGGENSIRSYQPNFAPPLGVYRDDDNKCQLVPQGGRSMINGNIEIRFPLIGNFRGVVFQDMGILIEKSFTEIVSNRFLTATGFGLRYKTPIGPFRFDVGWKWNKWNPEETAYAWFITLGHAF